MLLVCSAAVALVAGVLPPCGGATALYTADASLLHHTVAVVVDPLVIEPRFLPTSGIGAGRGGAGWGLSAPETSW